MSEFHDKTVIVTGASRGIGAAIARHFGRAGARVVLAARSADATEAVAEDIRRRGGSAVSRRCDVGDFAEVEALVNFAVAAFGRLDVVINNAGAIEPIARLADSDPRAWSEVVDANYKSVYYALRCSIPVMLEGGSGVIVNMSSGAATSALEGWSHYCSSKAAALSLTRCAHREYGDRGIRIVGLSPGTVATAMQTAIRASGINPVSQLEPSAHIPPEWVARAVAYLCSDAGAEFSGTDFSLKNRNGRERVGLPVD